jgi:hypothetical protein
MSRFEKKSVNNGNLAIWLNSLKLGHLQTPQGKKTLGKKDHRVFYTPGKDKIH